MTIYKDIINQDTPLWYYQLQETTGSSIIEVNNKSSGTGYNLSYNAIMNQRLLFNGLSFNGTSSYIQLPFNTSFNEFSVSVWFISQINTQTNSHLLSHSEIVATNNANFPFSIRINQLATQLTVRLDSGSDANVDLTLTASMNPNVLYHLAITRNGISGLCSLYMNGVLIASGILSTVLSTYSGNWLIGKSNESGVGIGTSYFTGIIGQIAFFDYELTLSKIQNHYWNGLSNLDVSSPVLDPYLNNVILSTHCEQALTNGDPYNRNTCLLLHFNGSNNSSNFIDETGKTIVPINNAILSSAQKKFGISSGYFNNDSLLQVTSSDFMFGSGDFTLECFVMLPVELGSKNSWIFDSRTTQNPSGIVLFFDSNKRLIVYCDVTYYNTTITLSTNVWYHIALVKQSNEYTIFINGVRDLIFTNPLQLTNKTISIGRRYEPIPSQTATAIYIDELRITRLLSRYRYNYDIAIPTSEYQYLQDSTFDQYSGYAVLDLDFNPRNNNYSFIDSIRNATITTNLNAALSTSQKKTGETSGYFSDGDYIQIANITDYNLAVFDFTIEFDVYLSNYASNIGGVYSSVLIAKDSLNNREFELFITGTSNSFTEITFQGFSSNTVYQSINGLFNFSLNVWYNIAVSRIGNDLFIFIDGNPINLVSAFDVVINATTSPIRIGGNSENYVHYLNGYIDNLRITRGVCKYTKRFIPSILQKVYTQLPIELRNTTLNINQSKRIISKNSRFGKSCFKFNYDSEYVYITPSNAFNLGNSNFTIELWYYKTATSPNGTYNRLIHSSGSDSIGSFGIYDSGATGNLGVYMSSNGSSWDVLANETINISLNIWHHIVVERNLSIFTIFINGVIKYQGQWLANGSLYYNSTYKWTIGGNVSVPNRSLNGYIDEVRITKGIARYTSSNYSSKYVLPTVPNSDIQLYTHIYKKYDDLFDNVCLLLHGDSFSDSSINNTAITASGNVITTTERSRFSNKSFKFTSYSDYLTTAINANFTFNAGDFTLELWCFPTVLAIGCLIDGRPLNTNGNYLTLYVNDNTGVVCAYANSIVLLTSSIGITNLAWNHIALVRKDNILTLYINGMKDVSCIDTTNYIQNRFLICANPFGTGTQYGFLGFVEDIRVTSRIARYIGTFELPTSQYPDSNKLNQQSFTSISNDQNNIVMRFPMSWNYVNTLDPDNLILSFAKYKLSGKAFNDDYTPASFVSVHSVDGTEYYTQIPSQITGYYEFLNLQNKQYYITVDSPGEHIPTCIGPVYPDLI